MKLNIFTWNLRGDKAGGSKLLELIADHYSSVDGETIGWISELPSGLAKNYKSFEIIHPVRNDYDPSHTSGLGAYIVSAGVKRIHDPDYAEEVYRRTYSTFFEINGVLIPFSGFHLFSKGHPTRGQNQSDRAMEAKDRIDRTTNYWLSPPLGQIFHPSLPFHICLGDFNDNPNEKSLADYLSFASTCDLDKVVKQQTGKVSGKDFMLRFNPAASWNGIPPGSYYFQSDPLTNWYSYDQILLCPEVAKKYVQNSFRVVDTLNGKSLSRILKKKLGLNVNIPNEKNYSDHFPVELVLEV